MNFRENDWGTRKKLPLSARSIGAKLEWRKATKNERQFRGRDSPGSAEDVRYYASEITVKVPGLRGERKDAKENDQEKAHKMTARKSAKDGQGGRGVVSVGRGYRKRGGNSGKEKKIRK